MSYRKCYVVLQHASVSSHLFSVILSEGRMSWKLHSLLCFQDQSSNKAGVTVYVYWLSFLIRQRFFCPYDSQSRHLTALLIRFKFPANLQILIPSPSLMFSPLMHL